MPRKSEILYEVYEVEKLEFEIYDQHNNPVHGNTHIDSSYPYVKAAKSSWTIGRLESERFNFLPTGFYARALSGGRPIARQTKLSSLR